jgi:outer membrane protein OmpA-like peptidoglycan-associated protein
VCQQWYVCHIKQKCGSLPNIEQPPAPVVDNRPLVFKWADPTAITRPTFQAYRDSILGKLPTDQLLEIVGLYFKDEQTPAGAANMGLARATKVKELLSGLLPAERLVVTSRLIAEQEGVRTKPFVGAEFNFKVPPKGDEVEIVEVDNTITILFPYGKSVKEANQRVDDYLEKLAARLKQTKETVSITGHTDDSGTIEFNQKLGLSRAGHIRDILLQKGISTERMTIASKGETEPVASNDTEEGSRQNRRVVLVLNKS